MKFWRYYHTIKGLQPSQLWHRFYYILKRFFIEQNRNWVYKHYQKNYVKALVTPHTNDKFLFNQRSFYTTEIEPLLHNVITFLNQTRSFGEEIDWHRSDLNVGTRLWKLNLNYHEFVIDVAKKHRDENNPIYLDYVIGTISGWITQNALGTKDYAKDCWNSYAISKRVVSWIRVYQLLHNYLPTDFSKKLMESLWIQGEFLKDNLEYDIIGNHLIKNWKALIWLGKFYKDDSYIKAAQALLKSNPLTVALTRKLSFPNLKHSP